jgi:hypothetical protein
VTVGDLREIINDAEIPPETPIRVMTARGISTWEWSLDGAHAQLAGEDAHLTLELSTDPSRRAGR